MSIKSFINMMLAKPRFRSKLYIRLLIGYFPYWKRVWVIISKIKICDSYQPASNSCSHAAQYGP
jgi:hypothetical protein